MGRLKQPSHVYWQARLCIVRLDSLHVLICRVFDTPLAPSAGKFLSRSAPIHHMLSARRALETSYLPGVPQLVLFTGTFPLISTLLSMTRLISQGCSRLCFRLISCVGTFRLALVHQALLTTSPLAKPALTFASLDSESHHYMSLHAVRDCMNLNKAGRSCTHALLYILSTFLSRHFSGCD